MFQFKDVTQILSNPFPGVSKNCPLEREMSPLGPNALIQEITELRDQQAGFWLWPFFKPAVRSRHNESQFSWPIKRPQAWPGLAWLDECCSNDLGWLVGWLVGLSLPSVM